MNERTKGEKASKKEKYRKLSGIHTVNNSVFVCLVRFTKFNKETKIGKWKIRVPD